MAAPMFALVSPAAYAIAVLLGAVGTVIGVALSRRDRPRVGALVARLIGFVLLADVVSYLVSSVLAGRFSARTSLPLALCNAAVVIAAAACLTRRPLLAELTWFVGIAGSLQALLTPDLSAPFPRLEFFEYLVGHVGVVAAALECVVGLGLEPRRGAPLRCFGVVAGYTAVVAVVDWAIGANYMFLRRAPSNPTLLGALGSYPYALVAAAAIGFALVVALDFPFFLRRRGLALTEFVNGVLAWAVTLLVGLLVWPTTLLIAPRRRLRLLVRTEHLLMVLVRIRVVLSGPPLPAEPCLLVANHASFLDGPILVSTLRRPTCLVVTGAFAAQRVAGPYLRALGVEFVGPGARRSVREQLGALDARLRAGEDVAGFPEGGIAPSGELGRLRLGLFRLAADAGRCVVPVAICNSRALLPPGRRLPHPGTVEVRYGVAIAPEATGHAGARTLADATRRALEAMLSVPNADEQRSAASLPAQ